MGEKVIGIVVIVCYFNIRLILSLLAASLYFGVIIFFAVFCSVTANYDNMTDFDYVSKFFNDLSTLERRTRDVSQNPKMHTFSCSDMANTDQTPFVVILLYKSEGRFVGMGSVINRRTVLSSARAVALAEAQPTHLLCLAGRMGPWWGNKSQVKRADEIFINDFSLALINLKESFVFGHNVAPIKVAEVEAPDYKEEYNTDAAVAGIYRSGWDIPGEVLPKTSRYITKIETMLSEDNGLDDCTTAFPDFDFKPQSHMCTAANGTYCWGCIGSPVVAVSSQDELLQIGVVVKTTDTTDTDNFHIATKLGPYAQWLKSHSHLDYGQPGPIDDNSTPPPPTTAAPAA